MILRCILTKCGCTLYGLGLSQKKKRGTQKAPEIKIIGGGFKPNIVLWSTHKQFKKKKIMGGRGWEKMPSLVCDLFMYVTIHSYYSIH